MAKRVKTAKRVKRGRPREYNFDRRLLSVRLSKTRYEDFKKSCSLNGLSMQGVLAELILKFIFKELYGGERK